MAAWQLEEGKRPESSGVSSPNLLCRSILGQVKAQETRSPDRKV